MVLLLLLLPAVGTTAGNSRLIFGAVTGTLPLGEVILSNRAGRLLRATGAYAVNTDRAVQLFACYAPPSGEWFLKQIVFFKEEFGKKQFLVINYRKDAPVCRVSASKPVASFGHLRLFQAPAKRLPADFTDKQGNRFRVIQCTAGNRRRAITLLNPLIPARDPLAVELIYTMIDKFPEFTGPLNDLLQKVQK